MSSTSCQLKSRNEAPEQSQTLIPEDFLDFYVKFHEDSLFQLNHIRFPLQGAPSMMDTLIDLNAFRWTKQDWIIHQPFDESNEEFERSLEVLTEDMIVEKITHINRSVGMERRFAKSEDGWHLIYYIGMNFLNEY
ncbi:MAG: DUF4348 domain-containing protein [Bacteroidia bacterium]|nr:DUF4348 domain-containing protein [Bacteroidia bacterium]